MLNQLVAHQRTTPRGLIVCTHINVLFVNIAAPTDGTPPPDIAVCTVRRCLAGIEGTAVQHTFPAIRKYGTAEACLQVFPRVGFHVLHLTAPWCFETLAIDEIPVVAHLEDVRAL